MWERFRSFRSRQEYQTRLNAINNLPITATTANEVIATFIDFNLASPSLNPYRAGGTQNPNEITASRLRNNGAALLTAGSTVIGKNIFRIITGASTPVVAGIAGFALSGARSGLELWRGGNANTLHARFEKKRNTITLGHATHRPEIDILERFVLGIRWNQARENALTPLDTSTTQVQEQLAYVRDNLRYLIALDTTYSLGALNQTRNRIDNGNVTTLRNNVNTAWNGLNEVGKRLVVEQIVRSQRRRATTAVAVNAVSTGIKAAALSEVFLLAADKIGNAARTLWNALPFNQHTPSISEQHIDLQPGTNTISNGIVQHHPHDTTYSVHGFAQGTMDQNLIQYDLQQHAASPADSHGLTGSNYINFLEHQGELSAARVHQLDLVNSDGSINWQNYTFSPHNGADLHYANYLHDHLTDAAGNSLGKDLSESIYNNGVNKIEASVHMLNNPDMFANSHADTLIATNPEAGNVTYIAPNIQGSAKDTIDTLYQFSSQESFNQLVNDFLTETANGNIKLSTDKMTQLTRILRRAGYFAGKFNWDVLSRSDISFLQDIGFITSELKQQIAA